MWLCVSTEPPNQCTKPAPPTTTPPTHLQQLLLQLLHPPPRLPQVLSQHLAPPPVPLPEEEEVQHQRGRHRRHAQRDLVRLRVGRGHAQPFQPVGGWGDAGANQCVNVGQKADPVARWVRSNLLDSVLSNQSGRETYTVARCEVTFCMNSDSSIWSVMAWTHSQNCSILLSVVEVRWAYVCMQRWVGCWWVGRRRNGRNRQRPNGQQCHGSDRVRSRGIFPHVHKPANWAVAAVAGPEWPPVSSAGWPLVLNAHIPYPTSLPSSHTRTVFEAIAGARGRGRGLVNRRGFHPVVVCMERVQGWCERQFPTVVASLVGAQHL